MRTLLSCVALPLFLMGCATTYQSQGFSGGFEETRLAEDVFQVTFNGNGYTSDQRASDLSLLRSADLTLLNGYRYFALMGGDVSSKNYSYTTPERTVTTGTVQTYGNTSQVNAYSQTYGGQTYSVSKPTATKLFQMFRDRPQLATGLAFDAKFVCDSIGQKYKTTCESLSASPEPFGKDDGRK